MKIKRIFAAGMFLAMSVPWLWGCGKQQSAEPSKVHAVSYTQLDGYKRQPKRRECGEEIMNTYSVLLVDDEEEVIQVIMKKINWEGLGFSVIGYANNGVKALEMMEELQPDVVMTDIKMPYMDGIELAKRVRAEFPVTKILFFTGFDEFEYAKEAIHLEAEEYILKPVNSVELTNVFTRLKIKLDQEISEKRNVEILQK